MITKLTPSRSKSGKIIATLLIAASMVIPTFAEEKEKGFYVAGDIGQATIKDYCTSARAAAEVVAAVTNTFGSISCSDSEIIWGGDVGYQLNKYFGVEGGLRFSSGYAADIILTNGTGNNFTYKSELEYYSALLGVRGTYPFNDSFSVHSNLGFHIWESETKVNAKGTGTFANVKSGTFKADGTDPYFGLGASYHFANNISARVNWTRAKYDESDVDVLTIGAKFLF